MDQRLDANLSAAQVREHARNLILQATLLARDAAASLSNGVSGATCESAEKQLDEFDKELDDKLPLCMAQATPEEVRELLACSKCMTDLERIGDLLANFCGRAAIVGVRLDEEDRQSLGRMATLVERMLDEFHRSFSTRDVEHALLMFKADSEIDRVRNLIYIRHSENPEGATRQDSLNVLLMAQALERAGDHAKNLAEEVIHLVTGKTARHLSHNQKESYQQMYKRWLRDRNRRIA
jgi:phosphate transport system protein